VDLRFFQQGADTVSLGPGHSQANPCDVSITTATREAYDSLNCFDIESKTRPRHRRPGRDERLLIRLPPLVAVPSHREVFDVRETFSWALLPIGPLNSLNVALHCEIEFAWNSGKFLEWPPLSANVL